MFDRGYIDTIIFNTALIILILYFNNFIKYIEFSAAMYCKTQNKCQL